MPARSEDDYEVIGLPKEENRKFWAIEQKVNYVWYRMINGFLMFALIVFNAQFFFVIFDVNIFVYVIVESLQILHTSYFLYAFLHAIYTVNLFSIEFMKFMEKKFGYLSKQIEELNNSKTRLIDNRSLAKLIFEYSYVQLELVEMNNFFKLFNLINLVHYFGVATLGCCFNLNLWRILHRLADCVNERLSLKVD